VNGGYMGLLALTDLKPEVRQAVESATVGQPVGPVESEDGYHLVQRGATVAGSTLEFEDAEPQVRDFLRREALAKARAAAVARMVADHPVEFAADQLGEWRVGLLQRAASAADTPTP
jgi:parvulin-like peptidyl-prolyl isomerase